MEAELRAYLKHEVSKRQLARYLAAKPAIDELNASLNGRINGGKSKGGHALAKKVIKDGEVHGTVWGYNRGCRCDACVKAKTAQKKRWRETQKLKVK